MPFYPGNQTALTISEGSLAVNPVTTLNFETGTLINAGAGLVNYTPPSGGGGGSVNYHDISSTTAIGTVYTAAQNMTILFWLTSSSQTYSGLRGCTSLGAGPVTVMVAQAGIPTTYAGGSFPVASGAEWGFNLDGTLGPVPDTFKVFAVY